MNATRPAPLQPWTPPAVPAAIAAPAPKLTYAKPAVTTVSKNTAYQQGPVGGGGGGTAAISQPGNTASIGVDTPQKSEAEIAQMAEVDSTFMDQKSMYAKALKNYIDDYERQKTGLGLDADTAKGGVERNRQVGLTGLSEDFSSRGLGNSGLFIDSLGKADTQYDKQRDNITTGLTNSIGDLDFRKSKFVAENGENGSNIQAARREAYARLAAAQNLT
jgi:hypothetical protein